MARTSKLPRYDEFNNASNAYGERAQNSDKLKAAIGERPLYLELGCGKAELSFGLAQKYKDKFFVGVDLKSDRLWRPSKDALDSGIKNIAFLQSDIRNLEEHIDHASVEQIWITFPDPYPKKRHAKHRMFNNNFIDIYKNLLKSDGLIRIKTDNLELFHWTLEMLAQRKDFTFNTICFNLHQSDLSDDFKIKTTYEKKFMKQGIDIKFLEGKFSQ